MGAAKKRNMVCDRASLKRALASSFLGREVRANLSEELKWAMENSARTKVRQMRWLDPRILGRHSLAGLSVPMQGWHLQDIESKCLLKFGTLGTPLMSPKS